MGHLQHNKGREAFKAVPQLGQNLFGTNIVHKGHDGCANQESTGHDNLHHAQHFLVALDAGFDVGLADAVLTVIIGQLHQAFIKGGKHHVDRVNAQHRKAQHDVQHQSDNAAESAKKHELHGSQVTAHAFTQNQSQKAKDGS